MRERWRSGCSCRAVPRSGAPESTYRLQFNQQFTFADATAIADYLNALGISDCYASSYLAAVPGSLHGYDVADPTRLNPEIGTDEEYWTWIEALNSHRMGHILDLVPNHMGIAGSANPWWQDVLENGPSSRYARFFDIEWHPVKDELADKLLIPILGDQYGVVLERQELQLAYDRGAFVVRYHGNVLPIAPDTLSTIFSVHLDAWAADQQAAGAHEQADELQSVLTSSRNLPSRSCRDGDEIAIRVREKEVVKRRLAALSDASPAVRSLIEMCVRHFNGVGGQPRSFDALDALLNEQSYRLAHWRVASEEINYRRFFDVNQLAALRMEDPQVFDEVHRFVLELIHRGAATGLRVDHVDGLYAPGDYLRRLQSRCAEAAGDPEAEPFFIVVEKILGRGEQLSTTWPVAGTTGYEFAAVINNLFVDARNERALTTIAKRFLRDRREQLSFADLAYRSKKAVLHETMSGDINSLGHQLNRSSERNRHYRDFTLYSLISTLKEVIACFAVYRTYITEHEPVSEHDRRYIVEAIRSAKRRAPGGTPLVFDFIQRLLFKQTAAATAADCEDRARFIGKLQQITGPVAAKGIEDTAFYVYNRLLSLNEVGADPTSFGLEPQTVHDWLAARQRQWPTALSASSTHDTKRGEDVRARLNVLSELPALWKEAVLKWRAVNRRFKTDVDGTLAPDPNEEYLLYQTLVGAWPFETPGPAFTERIETYMLKAIRESKVHTSWLSPDEPYEEAVRRFVRAILDQREGQRFLKMFAPFQARVAEVGIYNSLAQLVIKIAAPGVPDFYQGTELWDLNLVDPDNRRPVDYPRRRQLLDRLDWTPELLEQRADGRIKMFVMTRALAARRQHREAFAGEYAPLSITGTQSGSVFAFARGRSASQALVCVPRLVASMVEEPGGAPLGAVWGDTRVGVPEDAPAVFRDIFTGRTLEPERGAGGRGVSAALLFEQLPVALLVAS